MVEYFNVDESKELLQLVFVYQIREGIVVFQHSSGFSAIQSAQLLLQLGKVVDLPRAET